MTMSRPATFGLLILSALLGSASGCVLNPTILRQLEATADTNQVRTYEMCGKSQHQISRINFDFEPFELSKHGPLPVRRNLHLKCGADGSVTNGCWIIGGDIQLDASNVLGLIEDVDNVIIEGFTFISATRYSVWANKRGDITFINCVWRNHIKTLTPVLMDYFDGSSNSQLTMKFVDCVFQNNRYFGAGANTAIIYSNGGQNNLIIDRTIFSDNDMLFNNTMSTTRSFVIESLGPIDIKDSCFVDNKVGVANIGSFANSVLTSGNHVNQEGVGASCDYIAAYETYQQFTSNQPICRSFSSTACLALTTRPPTASPTLQPTQVPSASPSEVPTASPTMTAMPTPPPIEATESPTPVPVAAPTGDGLGIEPTSGPGSGPSPAATASSAHRCASVMSLTAVALGLLWFW